MRITAGRFKNRHIKAPKGLKTRPTSEKLRSSVFDILQNEIVRAEFLDLFAGSGAMGIEALSRGAKNATFVEKERKAVQCIRENLSTLELDALVLQTDAFNGVKRLAKQKRLFTIIYVDPPYELDIVDLLDELPTLLAPDGIILVEQSKKSSPSPKNLKEIKKRSFGDSTLFFFTHSALV